MAVLKQNIWLKNRRIAGIFFILTMIQTAGFTQDMSRVKENIDTLSSKFYFGRGAYKEGEKKASLFIQQAFIEAGLKPIKNENYFQVFLYPLVYYPGKMKCTISGKKLIPGKDFIVNAGSPGGKACKKIVVLDSANITDLSLYKNHKKTAYLYNESLSKQLQKTSKEIQEKIREAACIIEVKEKKLTMGVATELEKQNKIEILKSALPLNINNIRYQFESKYNEKYASQNVVGMIRGTESPDSTIYLTAHYDHLGSLGNKTFFPGANDNASGISLLIELAEYYKINPPKYTMVFIAFGAEESGLIGSKIYTENPFTPLSNIKFLINMDLMGTGVEGMMAVNGSVFKTQFAQLDSINQSKKYLPALKQRGKAANSDHYFFTEKGVPSFFFYTLGGITAYHDVWDKSETLPLSHYKEVFQLITNFVDRLSKH